MDFKTNTSFNIANTSSQEDFDDDFDNDFFSDEDEVQ